MSWIVVKIERDFSAQRFRRTWRRHRIGSRRLDINPPARLQVRLVAVAPAIGEPHLFDPRHVKRSDPLPRRGSGVQADGAITPAVYLRYSIKGIPLRELGNPTIDSLSLTAKELAE